jgi:predicted nucleic acid-binding protein
MIYVDTSFLVSCYVEDVHSPEAGRRLSAHNRLPVTVLNRTEFHHSIYAYAFRSLVTPGEAALIIEQFEMDRKSGVWLHTPMPETVWSRSLDLARNFAPRTGIRTLDSLHVACALELRAEKFWSFDDRQLKLAGICGLQTGA